MRNTIKAYLKTVEKSKADERARAATTDGTPTQPPMIGVGLNQDVEENGVPGAPDHHSPADVAGPEDTSALEVQPSVEVSHAPSDLSHLANSLFRTLTLTSTPNPPTS